MPQSTALLVESEDTHTHRVSFTKAIAEKEKKESYVTPQAIGKGKSRLCLSLSDQLNVAKLAKTLPWRLKSLSLSFPLAKQSRGEV